MGQRQTRANTSPLCHVHEVPDLASKDSNLFLYEFLDEHPKHKTPNLNPNELGLVGALPALMCHETVLGSAARSDLHSFWLQDLWQKRGGLQD